MVTADTDRRDAYTILAGQLAALRAEHGAGLTIYPDYLGDDLTLVTDMEVIGTRRTATIRLDVWRDEATNTHAGVRYLHHDDWGASDVTVVRVERVVTETWRVAR